LAGVIFAAQGKVSDGKAMFEKALAINPAFDEAKANLSRLKGAEK